MANYPSITLAQESNEELLDDVATDRAVDGSAKVRAFYTAAKRRFQVRHRMISASDKSTLLTFYGSNRATTITFSWGGTNYTCVFASPPRFSPAGGALWNADLTLEET